MEACRWETDEAQTPEHGPAAFYGQAMQVGGEGQGLWKTMKGCGGWSWLNQPDRTQAVIRHALGAGGGVGFLIRLENNRGFAKLT